MRAPAQVHASAAFVVAQPEAAVVVAQARDFVIAQNDAVSARQDRPVRRIAHAPAMRTRLSLKQSWLF
ncbi:MAG: hypothetical protein J7494_05855 [Sphingobium sp.]|nr:hypothetical protein [Sphingobium sp.]